MELCRRFLDSNSSCLHIYTLLSIYVMRSERKWPLYCMRTKMPRSACALVWSDQRFLCQLNRVNGNWRIHERTEEILTRLGECVSWSWPSHKNHFLSIRAMCHLSVLVTLNIWRENCWIKLELIFFWIKLSFLHFHYQQQNMEYKYK